MQKMTSKKKLLLYGCSGLGVNMLNLVVGSYLCSALLVGGFDEHIESWTYLNRDLVVAAIWSVLLLAARVLDGVIDLPLSSFTDRLRTRWGRRRPSIVIGFVPMVLAYVLFLVPLTPEKSVLNTIWFGALLCIFYAFYTLTMLTYYATFAEVARSERDMVFLSNVKSVCDVVYFIFGYALIPVFVSMGVNIRYVALIFLPLALSMMIPLFLLKEEPTNGAKSKERVRTRTLTLGGSIVCAMKNKSFIYWMFVASVVNFGLQLFLGGINELFSSTGLNMTVVMASSFAPVPLTILVYNKVVKKFGLGVAYRYILTVFSIGMIIMYICNRNSHTYTEMTLTMVAILGGIFVSFAIGAFFSVTYTVPSHLAQKEFERSGRTVSSMYFAVEGLFEGVAAGIATGPVLVYLKDSGHISWLPLVVAGACMAAFGMAFAFPKTISQMGKDTVSDGTEAVIASEREE